MTIAESNRPIPERIASIIKERGLKNGAVAEWAGFSKQQFSDMLNGRKIIKPCDAMAISDALGVSVGDLFVDTGQNSA